MPKSQTFEQKLSGFVGKFFTGIVRLSSTILAWAATAAQVMAEILGQYNHNVGSGVFWVLGGLTSIGSGLAGLGLQKRIKDLSTTNDRLSAENIIYEADIEFLLENMEVILEGQIIQMINDLDLSGECRICILRFEGRIDEGDPNFIQLAKFSLNEASCFFEKDILYKGTVRQAWEHGEFFFEFVKDPNDWDSWKSSAKEIKKLYNGHSLRHYRKRGFRPAAEYGYRISSDDHPIAIIYFESKKCGELDDEKIRTYIKSHKSQILRLLKSTERYYPSDLRYAQDEEL